MKVLVACEFSGIVRDAFIAEGHDAISCDLLPTERPGPHHQGDVRPMLREPWDLVIAHPPCQRLTWLNQTYKLWDKMENWEQEYLEARDFFLECLQSNAPRIAVENPIQHHRAKADIGPYSFLTCPTHFGASFTKRTGFWLQGLPPLMASIVYPKDQADTLVSTGRPSVGHYGGNKKKGIAHSKKDRNRFHPGMATAMARQWGCFHE